MNAPEQSGRYALFAMLLFRPWRNTRAALSLWSGLTTCRGISTDEIWAALAAEYISWRDRLQSEYAAACEGGEVPQYNTADWWRLLTYEKLRNFELTSLPKTCIERAGPLDASGKPMKLASESEDETSSDCSERDSSHAGQGHSSASHPTSNASVSHGCPVDLTSHPSTHDKLCGDIGGGYCNHLVYSQQEQGLQRRSPEANYLRDHVQALQNNGLGVSSVQLGDENVTPPSTSAIQRSLCQQLFQTQQQFFSDLDACHPSSEPLPSDPLCWRSRLRPCTNGTCDAFFANLVRARFLYSYLRHRRGHHAHPEGTPPRSTAA